ncbi:transposase [Ralstonia pickettii]|nr:transposase [Ralstonia pickettii]
MPIACTLSSKRAKKAYHISSSDNKPRTDQTRAKIGTERHQELSNYRAGVERVSSILKRTYQLEHLPVRGRVRSKIWIFAPIMPKTSKDAGNTSKRWSQPPPEDQLFLHSIF